MKHEHSLYVTQTFSKDTAPIGSIVKVISPFYGKSNKVLIEPGNYILERGPEGELFLSNGNSRILSLDNDVPIHDGQYCNIVISKFVGMSDRSPLFVTEVPFQSLSTGDMVKGVNGVVGRITKTKSKYDPFSDSVKQTVEITWQSDDGGLYGYPYDILQKVEYLGKPTE